MGGQEKLLLLLAEVRFVVGHLSADARRSRDLGLGVTTVVVG